MRAIIVLLPANSTNDLDFPNPFVMQLGHMVKSYLRSLIFKRSYLGPDLDPDWAACCSIHIYTYTSPFSISHSHLNSFLSALLMLLMMLLSKHKEPESPVIQESFSSPLQWFTAGPQATFSASLSQLQVCTSMKLFHSLSPGDCYLQQHYLLY